MPSLQNAVVRLSPVLDGVPTLTKRRARITRFLARLRQADGRQGPQAHIVPLALPPVAEYPRSRSCRTDAEVEAATVGVQARVLLSLNAECSQSMQPSRHDPVRLVGRGGLTHPLSHPPAPDCAGRRRTLQDTNASFCSIFRDGRGEHRTALDNSLADTPSATYLRYPIEIIK